MPKFTIIHTTTYNYDHQVYDSANQIMLYPMEDEWQKILTHQLKITGEPSVKIFKDYYGNTVGTFTHPELHSELQIESTLIINTKKRTLPNSSIFLDDQWKALKEMALQIPFINFLKQENFIASEEILKVVDLESHKHESPLQVAKFFCDYVFYNFQYEKGVTTVETTIDEIWKLKSGVCQDFAHILLVMLRYLNIPARYVSGYICPNRNGMRGEGATHAWVEAYIPEYGWLGLDPTNNCMVDDMHVRLAVGRNFVDCSPVKGTYKGNASHSLNVKVIVSYENDPQPKLDEIVEELINEKPQNSYRRFMEVQQQQQ
jgi:transglutaminase-like putative cysteine protease